jgi:hypothetical protein
MAPSGAARSPGRVVYPAIQIDLLAGEPMARAFLDQDEEFNVLLASAEKLELLVRAPGCGRDQADGHPATFAPFTRRRPPLLSRSR